MKFVRVKEGFDDGVAPLAERLIKELRAGKQVLWLVSGGSNIPLSVKVMRQLPYELTPRLAIFLADERYGEVGHIDSNLKQLTDAGFEPQLAKLIPVLVHELPLDRARERYERAVETALTHADVIIGQFGIGEDGHIAGILPGSPAIDADTLVATYEAPNYTRITLTPKALAGVSAAYVYAFGKAKETTLVELRDEAHDIHRQPAQLLKSLPEAYVYNDQIGDAI